jgi:hypothetical protein
MEEDDEEGGEGMEENLGREQGVKRGRQRSSRNVEEDTTRS